jgi:transcriptional regulator with XRE-family HTH domain
MTPGELLREARRRHGVTQAQLAARARTNPTAISRIECDRVSPSVARLATLLDLLGERLELRARPRRYRVNREVLRDNLALTPEERIIQGAELGNLIMGRRGRPSERTTLHLEIARVLCDSGNRWLGKEQIADLVNAAARYDGSAVTAADVDARTKNYAAVFERKRGRLRLTSPKA